ncbi:MAG: peptidase [Paracoccaceae bacterium]
MTYCVGLLLGDGIVCLSDTRTNAGVDNIATFRKTYRFERPGEQVMTIMAAGSLSVTQTTLARLTEAAEDPEAGPDRSIFATASMLEAAELVGRTLAEVTHEVTDRTDVGAQSAATTLILAGQKAGRALRLFLIYPQGNFIEATEDTPYLQIGEHKYGKPILDRVIRPDTSLRDAETAVLLSMDSTVRSNLSVGLPLDLTVIERDALRITRARRIEAEDADFEAMSRAWSAALRDAFTQIAALPGD